MQWISFDKTNFTVLWVVIYQANSITDPIWVEKGTVKVERLKCLA